MSSFQRVPGWVLALCILGGTAAQAGVDYAPMKPFEKFAEKTWRGEGKDDKGEKIVDISHWEFILGGKALQITHSINDGAYGGRTILFFDEGSKTYVFHYFTTAGFHTQGTATLEGDVLTTTEKVSGHKDIVEVRAVATLSEGKMVSTSQYVKKDGSVAPGHGFTYMPADGAQVVFKRAEP